MRAVLLAFVLLSGPVARAAASAPPVEARAEKQRGDSLRDAGDVAGALAAYRAALAIAPAYAEAAAAAGGLQYRQRAYADAAASFGAAVAADPGFANAWFNLATAARKAGDLQRARGAYAEYERLRPTDPDGPYGAAETLRALGDADGEAAAYGRFLALAGNDPALGARVAKARAALAERNGGVAAGTRGAAVVASPPATPPSAIATATAASTAGATAAATGTATPGPTPPSVVASASVISPEVQAKLDQGDRAFAASDYRGALFAFQDAMYLAPSAVVARVRLGRAYLALRYPAQAIAQAEQALAIDPASVDARRLLDDARAAPARPAATTSSSASAAPRSAARVYPLPDAAAAAAVPARTPAPAPAPPVVRAALPAEEVATGRPAAVPPGPSAAQRYRDALGLISSRAYAQAIEQLTLVLQQNPRFAYAYAARGSARFGLESYADAAADYQKALELEPGLATPLWGLAECYRLMGDPRAAALYRRYADSKASDVQEDQRAEALRRADEVSAR